MIVDPPRSAAPRQPRGEPSPGDLLRLQARPAGAADRRLPAPPPPDCPPGRRSGRGCAVPRRTAQRATGPFPLPWHPPRRRPGRRPDCRRRQHRERRRKTVLPRRPCRDGNCCRRRRDPGLGHRTTKQRARVGGGGRKGKVRVSGTGFSRPGLPGQRSGGARGRARHTRSPALTPHAQAPARPGPAPKDRDRECAVAVVPVDSRRGGVAAALAPEPWRGRDE